jgi:hypothetical protein
VGDFNETLYASEHFSRALRSEWQRRAFCEVVECSFNDLVWSGVEYTWDIGQNGGLNVKTRLDRAFGNDEFLNRFEHTSVPHIVKTESGHYFVLVIFCGHMAKERVWGDSQFQYENVWQTAVDYDKIFMDK